MERRTYEKGITLIALIITIIVLLILAMVSIRLVMNGGIVDRANRGTYTYSVSEEKEQIQLGYQEYQMAKFQETNPTLKVEGATSVSGDETTGWEIEFASGRTYNLAADGTIIGGGSEANLSEDSVASLAKAGEIQIEDKINYNPGTATTASINLPKGASIEGKKLASINLPAGASLGGTISASSATDWVVLDVNQSTGEVLIRPQNFSDVELTLTGMNGYNNSIEAINAVASIYKNPAYATNARGITIEDLNKLNGTNPLGKEVTSEWSNRYGMDSDLNIIDAGEGNTPSRTYTSTKETGSYEYIIHREHNFVKKNFWVASRCVTFYYNSGGFGVRRVKPDHYGYGLCEVDHTSLFNVARERRRRFKYDK